MNQIRAGHVQLRDVGEAGFLGDNRVAAGNWPHIGKRNQREQRPITEQQRGGNRHERARAKENKEQSAERVAERDAVEHAHQTHVRPGIREAAGINQTDDEQ